MRKTILTVIATLIILMVLFLIYIFSGAYNISQLSPHNKITKWVINTTTHNSIRARMKENAVPGNIKDTALIVLGFQHYNEMCVGCHGAPGIDQSEVIVKGLYPKPPAIYKHVEEGDAQEFFWIIKNGIKMTGMPAYKPTHDDAKIWAITAFVTQKLGNMSAAEYSSWSEKYAEHDKEEE